jgi:peptidoglycan/LPS O-acetylase OafA/YrhL
MGMTAATIGFSPRFEGSFWQRRVPWAWLALAAFGAMVAVLAMSDDVSAKLPLMDVLVSVFAFFLILACSCADPTRLPLRVLGSKPLVALGGFSYSLYLLQHPMLKLAQKALVRLELGADANLFLQIALVTPVLLALSWLFAELFEKPFTSGGILLPALRRRWEAAKVELETQVFAADAEPIPSSVRR